jgi:plasmid replication initiation protein
MDKMPAKKKQKRRLPPSTAIVTQSNDLVLARYSLPISEMRLLMTVISKIQPDDTKLTTYHIPIAEFADLLGVSRSSAYEEMKFISKSLLSRVVTITQQNGGELQTHWVASAKYTQGSGVVEIRLDEMMLPYLIGLNNNFTQCKLGMLLNFKSIYTNRLYMLLKQRRDHNPYTKNYEFEVGELRQLLGVSIEQIERTDKFSQAQEAIELYPEYRSFKKYVLEVAKKELDEKGDIGFSYEEIRRGKPVTAISFRVFAIVRNVIPAEEQLNLDLTAQSGTDLDFITTLLSFVPEQHRTKKGIRATIEAAEKQHGFDYVKRNILYSNAHASTNYAGYLGGALAIDYGHDWEIEQQQASRAAETAKPPTVTLLELNTLVDDIRALQRNSKLTGGAEFLQQAEVLKAEYARKREIYDAENTKEEAVTA